MLPDALQLQSLQKIELLDPWPGSAIGKAGASLLAGAMVLHFDFAALICSSPLRFMRNQSGTTITTSSADEIASLGYRLTLASPEDCSQWSPVGLQKEVIRPAQWLTSPGEECPAAHVVLHATWHQLYAANWSLKMRFMGGSYCLTWRLDLDGCIEFAPVGHRHTIDRIAVNSPADAFGWLHPAYPAPFVLDENCWRSAKVSDWPWPLRKALRSHQKPEKFYRDTLCRALATRFQQTPLLRQRLLALRYPLQVNDVPNGLIEEIAESLRHDS